MRKLMMIAALFLLMASLGRVMPILAVSGSITYEPGDNVSGPTCADSAIAFSYSVTGTTVDQVNNSVDFYRLAMIDGNGNEFVSYDNGVAVGYTASNEYVTTLEDATARPIRVELIDTTSASDPSMQPVLSSFTVDPASFAPACASLPFGSAFTPGAITWFNPGDSRIEPRPGDRIAVWCNTAAKPPTLVVYGVGDSSNGSHGFWLGTFNNADLQNAGAAGITKDAGAGNGTVSAMQDDDGNFYVAWNGGIFHATGHGDFAKSFSCDFPE